MSTSTLQERVEAVGFWWHSIDLGDGVVTPGRKTPDIHAFEWETFAGDLDLTGKSVLDIGSWDGYYAFRAEQAGAARVVALDSFIWGLDREVVDADNAERKAAGLPPRDPHEIPGATGHYDTLPGRKGFDVAHEALNSKVEPVIRDFATEDLSDLGEFDVVLFLGVLYHLREPLTGMAKVAGVTGEVAIVESEGIHIPGTDHVPLAMFAPHDEMSGDPTNWWAPNYDGLEALCHAAGFPHVEVRQPPPFQSTEITPCRLTVRAWKGAPAG